jgi:hypothetical protein
MWKNTAEQGKPQMKIRRMRIACWIRKATNTHSEYIRLKAFSTATVVARPLLDITLNEHYLLCIPSKL